MASLGKIERERIAERTRAGLERAVAKGIKLGRPRIDVAVRARIAAAVQAEPEISSYALARRFGCDIKTAIKYRAA